MFRKNESHLQPGLFSPENQMSKRLKAILKGHWSEFFYEKIFKSLDEDIFAPLYCKDNGRNNFPVNILVGLEILKELHDLTDEQLYENYLFNYTFHRALGIERIDDFIFGIRTLYNFRASLAKYEAETGTDLMLSVFKDGRDSMIEELGLKTGLQRTDSVMIAANIKRMNRLMLFQKVLSNLIRDIQYLGIELSEEYTNLVKEGENSIAYNLPKEKVPARLQELCKSLYQLIERFKDSQSVTDFQSFQDALRLLKEQCDIDKGKLTLRASEKISSSSMQNPADDDATYRKKRKEKHYGYATHVTETCDPDNLVQAITHVETVKNNVDDAKVLVEEIPVLKEETGLETIITDGGFVSDDSRDVCAENDVRLISTAIRGKTQPDDTLNSIDFEKNESGFIESCPAGNHPVSQKLTADKVLIANFNPKDCAGCPLKKKCIAYVSKKQSRIVIDKHRIWLDERQELLKTEGYKNLCRLRPAVEGLMEKIKPNYLNGRTKFRKLKRVKNRMILRAIGLNFRRLMVALSDFIFQIFCLPSPCRNFGFQM